MGLLYRSKIFHARGNLGSVPTIGQCFSTNSSARNCVVSRQAHPFEAGPPRFAEFASAACHTFSDDLRPRAVPLPVSCPCFLSVAPFPPFLRPRHPFPPGLFPVRAQSVPSPSPFSVPRARSVGPPRFVSPLFFLPPRLTALPPLPARPFVPPRRKRGRRETVRAGKRKRKETARAGKTRKPGISKRGRVWYNTKKPKNRQREATRA